MAVRRWRPQPTDHPGYEGHQGPVRLKTGKAGKRKTGRWLTIRKKGKLGSWPDPQPMREKKHDEHLRKRVHGERKKGALFRLLQKGNRRGKRRSGLGILTTAPPKKQPHPPSTKKNLSHVFGGPGRFLRRNDVTRRQHEGPDCGVPKNPPPEEAASCFC